jgi:hypothetical protein
VPEPEGVGVEEGVSLSVTVLEGVWLRVPLRVGEVPAERVAVDDGVTGGVRLALQVREGEGDTDCVGVRELVLD